MIMHRQHILVGCFCFSIALLYTILSIAAWYLQHVVLNERYPDEVGSSCREGRINLP
jgi:hypothetical protein